MKETSEKDIDRIAGVPGKQLLSFEGTIPKGDLKDMEQAIEDGCERVDRQQLLFRLEEAEKNLKAGKVKKVSVDKFIEGI